MPLLLALVPFITRTYGVADSWCWIQTQKYNCPGQDNKLILGVAEQFALLFIPGLIALIAASVAMITMTCVLYHREKMRDNLTQNGTIHTKALKHIVPLAAYPTTFCVLFILPVANRLYDASSSLQLTGLTVASAACVQLWGTTGGLTLLIHMGVLWRERRRKKTFSVQKNYRSVLLNH